MKVIIAGSRDFKDYILLEKSCLFLLNNKLNIEIISGGAQGADLLGEKFAIKMDYPIKYFLPDWGKNGKNAGFIRNKEMVNYGDILIAFWGGQSKGTKHMIDISREKGLEVKIIYYKKITGFI